MVGFNNRNGMEICLGLTSTVACEKYILLFIILLLFIMLLFFSVDNINKIQFLNNMEHEVKVHIFIITM